MPTNRPNRGNGAQKSDLPGICRFPMQNKMSILLIAAAIAAALPEHRPEINSYSEINSQTHGFNAKKR